MLKRAEKKSAQLMKSITIRFARIDFGSCARDKMNAMIDARTKVRTGL